MRYFIITAALTLSTIAYGMEEGNNNSAHSNNPPQAVPAKPITQVILPLEQLMDPTTVIPTHGLLGIRDQQLASVVFAAYELDTLCKCNNWEEGYEYLQSKRITTGDRASQLATPLRNYAYAVALAQKNFIQNPQLFWLCTWDNLRHKKLDHIEPIGSFGMTVEKGNPNIFTPPYALTHFSSAQIIKQLIHLQTNALGSWQINTKTFWKGALEGALYGGLLAGSLIFSTQQHPHHWKTETCAAMLLGATLIGYEKAQNAILTASHYFSTIRQQVEYGETINAIMTYDGREITQKTLEAKLPTETVLNNTNDIQSMTHQKLFDLLFTQNKTINDAPIKIVALNPE